RPCPCGQQGCLETQASGSALLRYWPAGGPQAGQHLLAAVDAGDADASTALEHLAEGTAIALRMLGLTLDPDVFVIGGGLRLLGEPLFEGVDRQLQELEAASPLLSGLRLGERVRVLPGGSTAAA